ncbi:TetR/AcrR family transcriptional regulator [Streptomyces sp. NPDC026672]|uniref:TetR/AcrR family transcriptional regulator n=1 Tax=unclassified Streptomyces TaxID=2593676 RepID=UPI003401F3D4
MTTPHTSYHHGNLRAALLDAAERKLAETGVDGLSLRELARDIGVSNGAPRRHFQDKHALLDALAVVGLERLGEEVDAALAASGGQGFAEQFTAFASAYVGFATRSPQMLELMFLRKTAAAGEEVRAAERRAFASAAELVGRARRSGDIDASDPDRTDMAILAVIQGLATLVLGHMAGDRDPDVLVTGTVRTLLDGLRPR